MKRHAPLVFGTACLCLWISLWGCGPHSASQAGRNSPRSNVPPDFALQFHVAGELSTDDPLRQTSRYVLLADLHLHAAAGPDAAQRSFPRLARILTYAEYEDLIRHVLRCHLMAEPSSPDSESPDTDLRYEVVLIAHGRTHRYTTTPAESPPTVQLLQKLVKARSPATQNAPTN